MEHELVSLDGGNHLVEATISRYFWLWDYVLHNQLKQLQTQTRSYIKGVMLYQIYPLVYKFASLLLGRPSFVPILPCLP